MGPVVVCGASFMAPAASPESLKGTHFSEIIAKKLNTDLVVLSTGGCSNFSISLQVEKAIQLKASLILAGNTMPDRIEVPIHNLENKEYDVNIDDMVYHLENFTSYRRTKSPKFMSTSLQDFFCKETIKHLKKECPQIDPKIESVKEYFLSLYDFNLKRKLDSFTIYSYYHKLHTSNIPYFICMESMTHDGGEQCPWLYNNGKYSNFYPRKEIEFIFKNDVDLISPYHTSTKSQHLIADLILKKYRIFLLKNYHEITNNRG
jgi:hypothetical protein